MSASMNATRNCNIYRRQLLGGVSAITLMASFYGSENASAADADRPILWIEAGWHFDRLSGSDDPFVPPFGVAPAWPANFSSFADAERKPPFAYGAEGALSFQPEDSDWIVSARVRYGHVPGKKSVHQQTSPAPIAYYIKGPGYTHTGTFGDLENKLADIQSRNNQRYLIADFQAGKDVGLGMLGHGGASTLSFGVRFSQFNSASGTNTKADPTFHSSGEPLLFGSVTILAPNQYWDDFISTAHDKHSFRGIGPSISWDASAALLGDAPSGEVTLDWGINGAVLFGRQKASAHHHTTHYHHTFGVFIYGRYVTQTAFNSPAPQDRGRSVIVPNLGGKIGLSFRYSNAKLSLGYRTDFFFNAMDGGIDVRKSENRGFSGPFASISVGVGD